MAASMSLSGKYTPAQRKEALSLCRAGTTAPEAARHLRIPASTVYGWCRAAGFAPPRGVGGKSQRERVEVCVRLRCKNSVPAGEGWIKGPAAQHCSWVCFHEDAYDAAEQEAKKEGLSGLAFRARASALFLTRTAPRGAA